ncbi:MAG: Gfo/Idh/MocA family oxidoreductase [Chloroflexi bacterium]|nr:Gfo/Idh/MocA family oxidoreductase [Chloroflexota bacterium]
MLRVGIIGYGSRVSHMAKGLAVYGIPYRVVAIADPRAAEIREANDPFLSEAAYYEDADDMLAEQGALDGVMVGTRCYLHAEMACKAAARNLPLFLEKPIAITFEQLAAVERAFRHVTAPTVVSFPLRLTPIVQRVREMLEANTIGTVEHVVAFNDVPYGDVYYNHWYRNYDQVGGLFLQKATHDFDYVNYLLGQRPKVLCAMNAQRIYGGDKPFDLRCIDCDEQETCPESPYNLFYQRYQGESVRQDPRRMCMFSEGIRNEDLGNCIVEYEGGAQLSYTQNFFARFRAARRGARLYGYRGTIHFDWYENAIHLYRHQSPMVETVGFTGEMPHFGGDRELCLDFLRAMRDGAPSRSPIEAGITSVLMCLWARESAEKRQFCDVVLPQGI